MGIFSKKNNLPDRAIDSGTGFQSVLKKALADSVCEINLNKVQTLIAVVGFVVASAVIMTIFLVNNSMIELEGYENNPLGANTIVLQLDDDSNLNIDDLKNFVSNNDMLAAAVPMDVIDNVEIYGNTGESVSYPVLVTDADFFKSNGIEIKDGKAFSSGDVNSRKAVALISEDIVEALFGSADPVGQEMKVGNQVYKVSGVFRGKNGYNPEELVVLPYKSARLVMNTVDISTYTLVCIDNVERAYESIDKYVTNLLNGEGYNLEFGYNTKSENKTRKITFVVFIMLILVSGFNLCMFTLYPAKRKRESSMICRTKHKMLYAFVKKEIICVLISLAGSIIGSFLGMFVSMLYLSIRGVEAVFGSCLWLIFLYIVLIAILFAVLAGIAPSFKEKNLIRHDMIK